MIVIRNPGSYDGRPIVIHGDIMRLFTHLENDRPRLGLAVDGRLYDLEAVYDSCREFKAQTKPRPFPMPLADLDMIKLMELGDTGQAILQGVEGYIRWLESHGDNAILRKARRNEEEMTWMPPVIDPPMLYGIGGNSPLFFRDKDYQIPAYPRGFIRPTNGHALLGHRARVTIPKQYETMRASAEMGVVIGKAGRNVTPQQAMDHVYGYTLVNDMCSDSWKVVAFGGEDESMMLKDLTIFTRRAATSYYSRSTDGFAAVGPWIVTKDEVPDPYNLMVWNRMSGTQRERSHTTAIVNSIERVVSFMSRLFTLQPGMIFHMGTMGIDGYTVEKDMLFGPEDYFEIEYERVGALRSYIKDERAA